MLRNPISFVREDYCSNCHTNNLECYDMYDKPINYPLLVNRGFNDNDLAKVVDSNRSLCYFRCKKCGEYFRLDWRNFKYPVPLRTEFFVNNFVNNTNSKI